MPEKAVVSVHPGPIPTAIGDVFEVGGFDFVNEAGGIGEMFFGGRGLGAEVVIDGEADFSNAGEEIDPWEEKPEDRADEAGPPCPAKVIENEEGGEEEGEGTEFSEEEGAAGSQSDSDDESGENDEESVHS